MPSCEARKAEGTNIASKLEARIDRLLQQYVTLERAEIGFVLFCMQCTVRKIVYQMCDFIAVHQT